MHVFLEQNIHGRDFVMGDLHGCYNLLMEEIRAAGFDRSRDRLISVGDIIDRGPDSAKCLTLLDEPWFHMVRGNHEHMMIEAIQKDRKLEWNAYGMWANKLTDKARRDWARRLADLPVAITLHCEGYDVGICHAEPAGYNWKQGELSDKDAAQMLWGRKLLEINPHKM